MSAAVMQPEAATASEDAQGSKKKLVIGIVVLLLAVGGAGYWFFLKPSGPAVPKPGAVAPLDSIQVNLADGHYLRLGIALQLTTGAGKDPVDGSKALNAAIEVFSGLPVAEVNKRSQREKLRGELEKDLEKAYDGDVMDVYFTEFVTQ
ncbi:MAG TPA: flagellar basal body-associated FliL family protein [Nocardioides sp.]|nr:flagellar basal body-associated FliL family protein [Nocardioides sp.]